MRTTRRHLLSVLSAATAALGLNGRASAATKTPSAAEGPFYPRPSMRHADTDNDLVRLAGGATQAGGEVVYLQGRVFNAAGAPQPGLRIEIWQCDVNGRYSHPGDRQRNLRDTGFQGFGHHITDASGRYRFRTIKPVPYPGRTPHIHVKVLRGESLLLTTQFYLKDHPANDRDPLYRRLTPQQASALSMDFDEGGTVSEARVNLIV